MSKTTNVIAGAALGVALAMVSASAWAVTPLVDLGVIGPDDSLSGSVVLTYTPSTSTLVYKFPTASYTLSSTGAVDLGFQFEVVGAPLTLTYADAANPISNGTKVLGGSPSIELYDATTSTAVTPTAAFSYDTFAHSWDATTSSVTLEAGTYIEYLVGTAVSGKTNLNVGVFTGGTAVPEPGIWALMLGGIAMMGAALRFGRKQGAGEIA